MGKFIDISGNRYGFLTVLYYDKERSSQKKESLWMCRCDCGNYKHCESHHLRAGKTVSCGCRRMDRPHITHGKTKTEIYRKWQSMKGRCNNPNFPHYSYYGGIGISVCKDWEDDFSKFYEWAIKNGYEEGLSIDRIDFNGNYEPSNCRWIELGKQQRNKRDTVFVTVCGVRKPLQEWSEISGVPSGALRERYRVGRKRGVEDFSSDFLSPSKKGVVNKVEQIGENGIVVKTWDSVKSVCEEMRLTESSVRQCCRGKREKYKGYSWRYVTK